MLTATATVLSAYFDVCRFRSGPQDLPASRPLLILTTCAYTIIEILINLFDLSADDALKLGLLAPALVLGSSLVLLYIVRLGGRWLQTATALTGTGIVFSVIALPLIVWLALIDQNDPSAAALPRTALFALVMWNLAVVAHIWKHALSANLAVAVGLALAFYLGSVLLVGMVIELPGPETPLGQ
jgi:hypothetical protein